jgi:hypothetical protein
MIASRTVLAALLASMSLAACVDLDDGQTFDETTSALTSASWTGSSYVRDELSYPPAMAMLNGVEYYVYAWDPGGNPNPWADLTHDLYWHQCTATGCTSPKRISDQQSMSRVSLAAFNGYIYMVHQGDSDEQAVWFSRLDPGTGQWTPNVKLPFATLGGTPALAAFNNQLYIVGSQEKEITRRGVTVTTYPLWYATMSANEVFSQTRWINSESASPPSLAALGNALYLAHRDGATGSIVLQTLPAGAGWSAPAHISAGPSSSYIQGVDVQLAAVNGFLHLIHHRLTGSLTYWTYNRGCDAWAPEISVPSFDYSSTPSLSTGRDGLVLNGLVDFGLWPYVDYGWYVHRFIAPPPPNTLPNCGAQG